MQINLYSTFRQIAGTKTMQLDLPAGTTVYGVVDRLLEKLPDLRRHWLDDQGEIRAHVHIFINGDEISTLADGWSTPLQPEDVLDFIPPVAGG